MDPTFLREAAWAGVGRRAGDEGEKQHTDGCSGLDFGPRNDQVISILGL